MFLFYLLIDLIQKKNASFIYIVYRYILTLTSFFHVRGEYFTLYERPLCIPLFPSSPTSSHPHHVCMVGICMSFGLITLQKIAKILQAGGARPVGHQVVLQQLPNPHLPVAPRHGHRATDH